MSRRGGQAGMTLVEVLVAATILLIGIASTFAVVARGQRLGNDAQRQQQAVELAQREVEAIRVVSYPQLGLAATVAPTATTCNAATTDPRSWLRSASPQPTLLIRTSYATCSGTTPAGVAATGEPLVVCGSCTVQPGPTAVSFGADGTKASVFRFVTTRTERACATSAQTSCTSTVTSKRITVAVLLDPRPGSGVTKPIWSSTIVMDPTAA